MARTAPIEEWKLVLDKGDDNRKNRLPNASVDDLNGGGTRISLPIWITEPRLLSPSPFEPKMQNTQFPDKVIPETSVKVNNIQTEVEDEQFSGKRVISENETLKS